MRMSKLLAGFVAIMFGAGVALATKGTIFVLYISPDTAIGLGILTAVLVFLSLGKLIHWRW